MSVALADRRIDDVDRRIIRATQAGLPLCSEPYRAVAEVVGIGADELMRRMRRMLDDGIIRRIAAVPNHYRLGYTANGMSVWDVPDAEIAAAGAAVGRLDFVSHCYRRPRHGTHWPYNLFAMVHGRSRADVQAKVDAIARHLGPLDGGHTVLYSTRILKKTGLRLAE
jgi:DNA-binding Lrp family transcriptional regulator